MTIDPELLEVMTQTITIQNPIPETGPGGGNPVLDGYGRHYVNTSGESGSTVVYGPAKTYACRLEYTMKVITDINGRDRRSSGRAYLAGFFPTLTTECKVTVPGQTQESLANPVIVYVDNSFDETGMGGYNTVLHFE